MKWPINFNKFCNNIKHIIPINSVKYIEKKFCKENDLIKTFLHEGGGLHELSPPGSPHGTKHAIDQQETRRFATRRCKTALLDTQ